MTRTTALLAAGVLAGGALACAAPAHAQTYKQVGGITVPGNPIAAYDLTTVDPAAHIYYFTDRSNKAVDMIDTQGMKFVGRVTGFAGATKSLDNAGPNGVALVPPLHQLWAGDGDSTVKVIDLTANPPATIATIPTGGKARADSMTFDAADNVVVEVNDADDPPFVTFISTGADHKILAKLDFPDASNGLEAPVYVAQTGMVYLSVPQMGPDKAKGGIAVIDPKAMKLVKTIPLEQCQAAGLIQGPGTELLVGCSQDAVEAGFKPTTVIVDAKSEAVVKTLTEIGGSDEVAFDPKAGMYFLAARGMKPGGPQLGVIKAAGNTWVQNIPSAKNAHSVAVDSGTGRVLMPQVAGAKCPTGCIAVFSAGS